MSDGAIAFAPYVGVIIPTHDYVTLGHAAPGRGLEEYWLGFYVATSLHQWIPRTYVDFRTNYAFVEEVANVSHDRTNLGLELGYYFNESVSARFFVARQWTHGGIGIPVPPTDPLFPYHDQLAEDEFLNVGGGFSWTLNDRVEDLWALHGVARGQELPQGRSSLYVRHELRHRPRAVLSRQPAASRLHSRDAWPLALIFLFPLPDSAGTLKLSFQIEFD